MSKPDWGELQRRFLSDNAKTGVSPKEWCAAEGLNYATTRRHIKKPTAQIAHNKLRTAQKNKSVDSLLESELPPQQKRFVAEYLIDQNATAAATRAGYSDSSYGRQLLTSLKLLRSSRRHRYCADEVLAQMWQLATFDAI